MGGRENMVIRRGQLKAAVTRFGNYLRSEKVDSVEAKARQEKIEDVWLEYDQVQTAIEAEDDIDLDEENAYRAEFEGLYFKNVALAEKIIMSNHAISESKPFQIEKKTDQSNVIQMCESKVTPMVKLAALNVPTFSGNYHEWASFCDIFSALVDKNIALSPIEKFFYLRAALSGDALNSIKCLEITANNYTVAWKSLNVRYNNKKVLVQAHVKALYDLETVSGESAVKLRQLADEISGHMRALESLGQEPIKWGPLLVHLIAIKLDKTTLKEWESKSSHDEIPSVIEMVEFLEMRFKILESVESAKNINTRNGGISIWKRPCEKRSSSQSFASTSELKCYICGLAHTIYKCTQFNGLTVQGRIKRITELKLCKICLRKHENKKCNARFCFKCAKPHNTLLHLSSDRNNFMRENKSMEQDSTANITTVSEIAEASTSINAHVAAIPDDRILLSTAIVLLRDEQGHFVPGRVLLDSGSQSNLITEDMVQTLKLKKKRVNHKLCGIGNGSQRISSMVKAIMASKYSDFTLTASCLVVTRITKNIPSRVITGKLSIPKNIKLADPCFQTPQKIDLLIGATYFFDLLRAGQLKPIADGPVFQETYFGWVVAGPVKNIKPAINENTSSAVYCLTSEKQETDLEKLIAKFWRIEEYEKKTIYTNEEKMCRVNFEKNVKRDTTGRFRVHLPFKNDVSKLGNSYNIAKRRLLLLEKRFQKDPELKADYVKFMSEYEELGHMEQVDEGVGKSYYIPHHAVRNESSTTTKVRVVFDASCKTDTGVSLNDILLKGPVIQEELLYILLRFRTYTYVLTADIEKMYRQILVDGSHCDFQRVLWRPEPTQEIKIYRLNTLTYGTVPASFLATACLKKIGGIGMQRISRCIFINRKRLLYG